MVLDPNDNGYSSRKYILALVSMGLLILMGLLTTIMPVLLEAYGTLVGGIITLYGLYCGVNTATKWVVGRANTQVSGSIRTRKRVVEEESEEGEE